MDRNELWDQIYLKREETNNLLNSFWSRYSHIGTWQFWLSALFLLIPLVVLYFKVDRRRLFEVLFFGYTVHMLWTYADVVLELHTYLAHPYMITSLLPFGMSITASLIPVSCLLLYQYCTNHNKNFYLYSLLLGAALAFVFATISIYLGVLVFRKGMNQFFLFLIDMGVFYLSYWLTKLFVLMKNYKNLNKQELYKEYTLIFEGGKLDKEKAK